MFELSILQDLGWRPTQFLVGNVFLGEGYEVNILQDTKPPSQSQRESPNFQEINILLGYYNPKAY